MAMNMVITSQPAFTLLSLNYRLNLLAGRHQQSHDTSQANLLFIHYQSFHLLHLTAYETALTRQNQGFLTRLELHCHPSHISPATKGGVIGSVAGITIQLIPYIGEVNSFQIQFYAVT